MKTELRYGKRIKEERAARGWTQEHLAEVAGIAARTVARIEKDEVKGPESLMAIAAAFGAELRQLTTVLRIAEAKPPRALLVRQSEDLQIAFQRAYHSGLYRTLLLPMRDDIRERAEELLEAIFVDLQYLSPDELDVLRSWVVAAKEPMAELRAMGMEIFTLQDKREGFVGEAGQRKLMEKWTTGYYLVVLEHGCFTTDGRIHSFNDQCIEGIGALHRWLRQDEDGAEVQLSLFANAFVALQSQEPTNFCTTCFPAGPTVDFMTEEYLNRVAGCTSEQLQALFAAFKKEVESQK